MSRAFAHRVGFYHGRDGSYKTCPVDLLAGCRGLFECNVAGWFRFHQEKESFRWEFHHIKIVKHSDKSFKYYLLFQRRQT